MSVRARDRLVWRLLAIHVLVIGLVILIVWLTIDYLAADYFMALMKEYKISPTEVHQMFLQAAHRYLLWASAAAFVLALVLSLLFTSRLLEPLARLTEMTAKISGGDYSAARVQTTAAGEVGDLATAFNRMADNLTRIEQLRKTMVGDVAHELRTPLTNIRGYLEAVNDGVIPHSPALMQSLLEETLRLVKLVDDLAQLARADASRLHMRPVAIVLSECVSHALHLARAQFEAKAIAIDVSLPDTLPAIVADRDSVLQALSNLLQNACQYTPQGGVMSIRAEAVAGEVRTSITNTGEVSAPDLPLIFERFYRGEKSRSRDSGGAGIGLAIVKELIEANGGHVGAESADGTVTVWLALPALLVEMRETGSV